MFDKSAYMKEYNKKWNVEHPDYFKQYNKQYIASHPEYVKKWNDIRSPIYNPRRITFKGKMVHVNKNPRKGVCSRCGKKKGDPHINANGKHTTVITSMHHTQYDESDPLKHTVELCNKCHREEHLRTPFLNR